MSIDIYKIMCYIRHMFDKIIYRTLDAIISLCERYKEYRFNKTIPKPDPAELKRWVKSLTN